MRCARSCIVAALKLSVDIVESQAYIPPRGTTHVPTKRKARPSTGRAFLLSVADGASSAKALGAFSFPLRSC